MPREPLFFGDARWRFGTVHAPARASDLAYVIVPPFGFEEICAHRSLRALADAAAADGALAIRFDLDGTGDSEGDDLEPGRLAAWLASIDDAIRLARDRGATRIVVVGVRLGATLAVLAAAKRDDIAGVVAIAPVVKPKPYLRELYALQMQLGLPPAPSDVVHDVPVTEETVGFVITAATRAELSAIDLAKVETPCAPRVLVIDRDDQKPNDAWLAALRGAGVDASHARLPGYMEMMADPHKAVPPTQMFDATLAFGRETVARIPSAAHHAVRVAKTAAFADFQESVAQIDDAIVGVITAPKATRPSRVLLLLSCGATHRIGPNRIYVALARRLAARGVAIVRIDQSSIGDSDNRRGIDDNTVYGEHALADVRAITAWAKRTFELGRGGQLVATGLCSGAFHAMREAIDGKTLDAAIPINTPIFHYEPGVPLDWWAAAASRDAQRYKKVIGEGKSWKKLLRGDVNLRAAVGVVARRARDTTKELAKDLARRAKLPLPNDFPTQLRAFVDRGGIARFIFAEDDSGREILAENAGSMLDQLVETKRVSIVTLAGADHTFTPRWTQLRLIDAIEHALLSQSG